MSADRARLRADRDAARLVVLGWVRRSRWVQRWITLAGVIAGPALIGAAGCLSGNLQPADGGGLTWRGVVLAAGIVLAAVGGVLSLLIQESMADLLLRAEALESSAQAFLDDRDRLLAERIDQQALDGRRLALIDAGHNMLEACENALGVPELGLDAAIEMALRAGQRAMLNAIDFDRDEYWAVSIFRVEGEELRRIVALRPDPLEEAVIGRTWRRGEGFAGMAWLRDTEVVITDCNLAEVAAAYVVPPDKQLGSDPERYRSMAVIPIRVGPADEFWGCVAVSSNRVGRFRPDGGDSRTKNVDTSRLVGRTVELLVAGFSRGNQ